MMKSSSRVNHAQVHGLSILRHVRALGLVCALLLLSGGCAKKDLSPEQTYKKFFQSMHLYAQDQNQALQELAYDLLSSTAQEELISKAESINRDLPEDAHIKPYMLLVSTGVSLGAPISRITPSQKSETEVLLDVEFPNGKTTVMMVLEKDQWRVQPEALTPSGGSKTQGGTQP